MNRASITFLGLCSVAQVFAQGTSSLTTLVARPQVLSKSLIFDQSFDQKSVLPAPQFRQSPLAAVVPATAPRKIQQVSTVQDLLKTDAPSLFSSLDAISKRVQISARVSRELARLTEFQVAEAEKANQALPLSVASNATATPVLVKVAPQALPQQPSQTHLATNARQLKKLPKAKKSESLVLVLDGQALLQGERMMVPQAEVRWLSPNSKISTTVDDQGVSKAPYPTTLSMRFVVNATGFIPAVGYAAEGRVTVVTMISEAQVAPTIKSLNVVPKPNETLLFGQFLDQNLKPLSEMTLETSRGDEAKVHYALGSLGLFHPKALKTGDSGLFLVSGLAKGLQYLLPSHNLQNTQDDWAASLVNFDQIGPVVSTTIVSTDKANFEAHVVDAFSLERPEGVGIQILVGGQSGILVPNEDGYVELKGLRPRSTPDLIEVRAQGYLTTRINAIPGSSAFPEVFALFTGSQVQELLKGSTVNYDPSQALVVGNLSLEKHRRSRRIEIYDGAGKKVQAARILYFDDQNRVSNAQSTHTSVQNFAIAGLASGEYQVMAIDPVTGQGLETQLVRVDAETISQVQF